MTASDPPFSKSIPPTHHIDRAELKQIGLEFQADDTIPDLAQELKDHVGSEAEPTVWHGRPSPRKQLTLVGIRLLVIGAALLAFGQLAGPSLTGLPGWGWVLAGIFLAVAAMLLMRAVWVLLSMHYRITSERVLFYQGLFKREITELEFVLLEDIQLHQTMTQRLFEVADVELLAPNTAIKRAILHDIDRFYKVKEIVRSLLYHNRYRNNVLISRGLAGRES